MKVKFEYCYKGYDFDYEEECYLFLGTINDNSFKVTIGCENNCIDQCYIGRITNEEENYIMDYCYENKNDLIIGIVK